MTGGPAAPSSAQDLARALAGTGYLADPGLATAGWLALRMGRPLFLEGEAGVGKPIPGNLTQTHI